MAADSRITTQTVTLTTSASTTPEVPLGAKWRGIVYVPTGSSITTLTFHVSDRVGGTYVPLYTTGGAAVTQTVAAARAYPLPSSIAGAGSMRIVGDAGGAVTITKLE